MARFVLFFVVCLLAQAFCVPAGSRPGSRPRPLRADSGFNSDDHNSSQTSSATIELDDDDDDDFEESMQAAPSTGGGSNIISLLNLATALFPSASGASSSSQGATDQLQSPLWTLKTDILRAMLQFVTSILGIASASFTRAVTV